MNILRQKKITIFLYHDINNEPSKFCKDFNLNVSPSIFIKQIKLINKKFNIISPDQLLNQKKLPDNPALITFDDGFLGAFNNGIQYLVENKIPSIMFLNMGHIINNSPLVSSKALFYQNFCNELNLKKNQMLHLTLNPNNLLKIESKLSKSYDKDIFEYQGKLADLNLVTEYAKNNYVYYGNHLFEHWNSNALNNHEFLNNLKKNETKLKDLGNYSEYFAFPNGKFINDHIKKLKKIGMKKIFYSAGKINFNSNNFNLDRIALTDLEYNSIKLSIRLLKSNYNNFFLNKFLGILRRL
jgi:peptidoglycan/xylan/chitin deacetylase (PgdA/CDA1 family)